MLKNLVKTAFRNIVRNKTSSVINVLGLALGMSCSLVIFLLIKYDLSFDHFQPNRDRIFRVTTFGKSASEYYPGSAFPLAKALRSEFPEFEQVVHISYVRSGQFTITAGGDVTRYQESEGVAFVEPGFFDMFYSEWLAGNAEQALSEPNAVVLTESLAKKYFPDNAALNQVIRLDSEVDLKVTGIIKDFPSNTNFPFTALISFQSLKGYDSHYEEQSWNRTSSSLQAYVLFGAGTAPEGIEAAFPRFTEKYLGERALRRVAFILQPLTEIHFDTKYGDNFSDRTVSKESIGALVVLAVVMILMACINFVNLATAQATRRSKEVGVRKVIGSSRPQLFWQFLGETALVTLFAASCCVMFTEFLLLQLSGLIGLGEAAALQLDLQSILFLSLTSIVVIVLAGAYPAVVLTRFNPVHAIKSTVSVGHTRRLSLRSGLVVLQFAASQILIIATIVVSSQLNYFREKPLGFSKDAVLTVHLPNNDASKLQVLRNRLLQNSNINHVSFSNGTPSDDNVSGWEVTYTQDNREENIHIELKYTDEHYVDLYGLQLLAGRNLLPDEASENIVANETFIRRIGFAIPEEAVGQPLPFGAGEYRIVGVVKDFHTQSLHEAIAPCFLVNRPDRFFKAGIRVNVHNLQDAIRHIREAWSGIYPEHLFAYRFLQDEIQSYYEEEVRVAGLIKLSSIVIVFIGCLGLYGMVSFVVSRKTKEIGIRKVLGASALSLYLSLSVDFCKLLLAAFVLAAPIAYLFMNNWLQNFAYRIDIGAGVFALAGGLSLFIALLTFGFKSLKAALANPVDSLRYE